MKPGPLFVALVLVLGACSGDSPDQRAADPKERRREAESKPTPSEKIKKRKPTGPQKAKVMNDALGDAEVLTRRAIADLKRLGFWKPLTKKIHGIRVTSRQRSLTIPTDGHLADSLWTYYKDDKTGEWGDLCDVLFFTRAVKNDVANQRAYWAEGRLDHPPPTLRQFWAVLLGHEMAHCSKRGQKGEAWSTRWESRILAGYGIDRIGSP